MTIKLIRAYKTDDGKIFENEDDAKNYDLRMQLKASFDREFNPAIFKEIMTWILDEWETLIKLNGVDDYD